jgi:hypothetical protein
MIAAILTRYRLPIAGALAFAGLLMVLMYYRSGWQAEKAGRERDRASYALAQSQAEAKAIAALQATEARYRDKANDADQTYQAGLADARSAADRFIAANRVRGKAARCEASGAVASADGADPGVPDDVPALVVMDEADVRAAGEWQEFGSQCRAWALTLGE